MPILQLSNPSFISVDGAGRVNAGGTVEVYLADGLFSTFATIYSDQVKAAELTNPVTLDDAGTKEIWYDVKVDIREKTKAGVLIRDTENLDPNAGNAVVQSFNLANNGSFEIDETNDGQPDGWTITPYTGSAIAITNDIVTDGVKALEFNTGAADSGGGTATSAKFPVTEGSVCSVAWSFYATHATTLNTFVIKWYDEDDVYQSESTLTMPASGSVSTSWTTYQEEVTVNAAGTQGEIVLVGIASGGSNLSSKAYFDGISIIYAPGLAINSDIGRGALVYSAGDVAISDSTVTAVAWDSENYDTNTIHDTATNNTRLTVPTGITKVRLSTCIVWESNATGLRRVSISKNGSTTYPPGLPGNQSMEVSATNTIIVQSSCSSVITVVGGDYFEVDVNQNSGGDLNVDADNTSTGSSWFAMEIIK